MPGESLLRPVVDHADWLGCDLSTGHGWLYQLSQSEIDALVEMARQLGKRLANNPDALVYCSKEAINLGPCTSLIERVYEGLQHGLGLALIRGLPVKQLSKLEMATIYWGIGQYLGSAVSNNPDGDLFGHVTDLGKTQSDPHSRGYQTRETMDYHCDQCDIVGLMCVRTAKSGGVSYVTSSVAMYNTLLRKHPEYAAALTEPLCWTKHGEHNEDELPYYLSPVFNFTGQTLCTSFGPKHIVKGHALEQTPPLSDLQRDAIKTAESIAAAQRYEMTLHPGDMQFLNNYVVLHTRSAYVDHDAPEKKRLLWRLWLMNPTLRPRTGYTLQWQAGVNLAQTTRRIRL